MTRQISTKQTTRGRFPPGLSFALLFHRFLSVHNRALPKRHAGRNRYLRTGSSYGRVCAFAPNLLPMAQGQRAVMLTA